jgi:hypothetical protein
MNSVGTGNAAGTVRTRIANLGCCVFEVHTSLIASLLREDPFNKQSWK